MFQLLVLLFIINLLSLRRSRFPGKFKNFLKQQKQLPEAFCKKGVLKNFAVLTRKYLCWSLVLIKLQTIKHLTSGLQLHQKVTPTQVFICEYCAMFKNTYFEEHL